MLYIYIYIYIYIYDISRLRVKVRCKSSGLVRCVESYDVRVHPAGLPVSISIDINTKIFYELQNMLSLYKTLR